MNVVAQQLRKKGFDVVEFSGGYHCRVNREFDFWTNERGRPLTWNDRITGEWGKKPEGQLANFIIHRLSEPRLEVDEHTFVDRLMGIGWTREEAQKQWKERQSQVGQV